jgi:Ni/Fe-hydrogenase subunit HybB-like protein
MVVLGFVLNRLNITVTGMEGWAGVTYIPSWMEMAVTVGIVTLGFVAFAMAVKYLPVFKHDAHDEERHLDLVSDLRAVSRAA